jgi:ATP-dependent Clp protease ATP-binding subunit ClpB
LELTEAASLEIATIGYDPTYGARPLKRALQTHILNPLAAAILRGDVKEGSHVRVDYRDGEFKFESEPAVTA